MAEVLGRTAVVWEFHAQGGASPPPPPPPAGPGIRFELPVSSGGQIFGYDGFGANAGQQIVIAPSGGAHSKTKQRRRPVQFYSDEKREAPVEVKAPTPAPKPAPTPTPAPKPQPEQAVSSLVRVVAEAMQTAPTVNADQIASMVYPMVMQALEPVVIQVVQRLESERRQSRVAPNNQAAIQAATLLLLSDREENAS